jgi:flagellar motor switch protein FliM
MALARMFFADLVEDLSAVWEDSAGLGIELGSLESHADAGELSLVSEPTLAITCEVRLGGLSTTLTLVVPYRSIEPVADRLAATGAREGQGGDEARRQMSGALSAVELAVRAEVASVDLPIARIATLRPGDLIEFNRLASDGVTLYAGSALLGRGAPGQSTGRRAVQFLGPEGGPR